MTFKEFEEIEAGNHIALIWCIEDVHLATDNRLTDVQAKEVLRTVKRRHDAEIGVNWLVLECTADELYPKKKDDCETDSSFWDCECESDFIHTKSVLRCSKCNTFQNEQPDSRVKEVTQCQRF